MIETAFSMARLGTEVNACGGTLTKRASALADGCLAGVAGSDTPGGMTAIRSSRTPAMRKHVPGRLAVCHDGSPRAPQRPLFELFSQNTHPPAHDSFPTAKPDV